MNYTEELNFLIDTLLRAMAEDCDMAVHVLSMHDELLMDMSECSDQWQLCSVGSLCDAIPRRKDSPFKNAPLDKFLFDKGMIFNWCLEGAAEIMALYSDGEKDDIDLDSRSHDLLEKFIDDYNKKNPDDWMSMRTLIQDDCHKAHIILAYLQLALETHEAIENRAGEILDVMFPTKEDWSHYTLT